jgi:protoporphyrinogen oxidase
MQKRRIAIIGAGPSGFGVAEVLRQEEFIDHFDITIYESSGYVGGKCRTILEDGSIANGSLGGYEVGAGFVPRFARSYADLMHIIKKNNIKLRSVEQPNRPTYHYVKNGKTVSVGQLHIRQLFIKPGVFIEVLLSYLGYTAKYIRYGNPKRIGFSKLPEALKKTLPKNYNPPALSRYAHVVQGFGYADIDDAYLRPPLAYYFAYLEPAMKPPLSMINGGTQGIWAKVASTYPKDCIRLNEPVKSIHRSKEKVTVKTAKGSEDYDYLVVATSLKAALGYLDISATQREFISRMKYNHYITILCKVSGLEAVGTFNLSACTDNTRLGQVLFCSKQDENSDIVTLNLYIDTHKKVSDETILKDAEDSLMKDFGATLVEKQEARIFHWDDYFGHLSEHDINEGWYDVFEQDFQGKNRTLYVSSGLHMETIGGAVQYATKQTKKYATAWLNQI